LEFDNPATTIDRQIKLLRDYMHLHDTAGPKEILLKFGLEIDCLGHVYYQV